MRNMNPKGEWSGRFPKNGIISLLQTNRRHNLAESTSQDLTTGELLNFIGLDEVKDIRLGYGHDQGLSMLREEIGVLCNVPADHVITTTGAALAIYLLAIELCRPKDSVVLFTPCFATSKNAFVGANINLTCLHLNFEDNYEIDLEDFESSLTRNTKLVCMASPQNPSGVTTDVGTIKSMLKIMGRCAPGAYLFIDEVYLHATYGHSLTPESFASLSPKIITCGSVSKAFGAPGLRVGWMTVQQKDLRDRLITAKMNIVISGSPLNETLAAYLLRQRDAVLGPRKSILDTGLKSVELWQKQEASRIDWVRPDAGALCCMRLRKKAFSARTVDCFWRAQEDLNLQLGEGKWFGEDNYLFRLGFGYLPINRLSNALSVLSKAMDIAITSDSEKQSQDQRL